MIDITATVITVVLVVVLVVRERSRAKRFGGSGRWSRYPERIPTPTRCSGRWGSIWTGDVWGNEAPEQVQEAAE
jgi:hypothetical protein